MIEEKKVQLKDKIVIVKVSCNQDAYRFVHDGKRVLFKPKFIDSKVKLGTIHEIVECETLEDCEEEIKKLGLKT